MRKGSITVFLLLILTVTLTLTAASIQSVKNAACRVQILNGMDIGLYSLFAQYDQTVLEKYHLLLLDGTWGSDQLNIGKLCDEIQEYMEPVLEQNHASMSIESLGLTGYTLAADQDGIWFFRQAVQYMKETMGIQAAEGILEKVKEQADQCREEKNVWEEAKEEQVMEEYETQLEEAAAAVQETGEEDAETELVQPAENPIPDIQKMQQMGILELILENPQEVSQKKVKKERLLSQRKKEKGMNPQTAEETGDALENLLFQEYLFQVCGCYLEEKPGELSYQLEYILFGKESDTENLKAAANRILLIREGLNFACLLGDAQKRAEAKALAAAVAAAILFPPAEAVIETALLLCWSFAESIMDLRLLFQGENVAVLKDRASWQISLENLPRLSENWGEENRGNGKGMSYQDYLRIFFYLSPQKEKVERALDTVEMGVRSSEGRENFRLDCCISSLEAEAAVKTAIKTYRITRSYGYCQE